MAISLETWLENAGLHSNPFDSTEADKEKDKLFDYFIPPSCFRAILGSADTPRTAFLFAERGCGKSTNRRVIDAYCQEGKAGGRVLSVPYLESGLLVRQVNGDLSQITVDLHLKEILKAALIALFDLLKVEPALADRLYGGDIAVLKWYTTTFSNVLTMPRIEWLLREIGVLSAEVNAEILWQAARADDVRASLLEKVTEKYKPLVSLLVKLIEIQPLARKGLLHLDIMRDFVCLVQIMGIKAIYILVDRVDELPETAVDPEIGAALLAPLVTDLHLMELRGVAFKFFLPSFLADAVRSNLAVRTDRLPFERIEWDDAGLVKILQNRLRVYSDALFDSLEAISEPELKGIDEALARRAVGSPRNLLRLGEFLFDEHCRLADGDELLSTRDLNAALERFDELLAHKARRQVQVERGEEVPTTGLFLDKDGAVWREGEKLDVSLAPREYKLLEYLCAHRGQRCAKYDLIVAVWGEDEADYVEDSNFSRLVYLLRRKVEPEPGEPRYVITEPGYGLRLGK